jgi:outer membrane lipoprotein-sorting protein
VSVRRTFLDSVLVLLLVGGCAVAIPARREPVSEEARAAVALLIQRWHEFSDLRALADIVVTRRGERQRVNGVLLARAPASLRFEALSPFGAPLLVLTVHREQLVAYNAATNQATIGVANAETAAKMLSLAVDPDDVVAILAGRTVIPKDLRVAEILPPDEHGPSLDLIGGLHRQRVWMDFTTGLVQRLEIVGGRYVARVVFQRDGDALKGLDLDAAEGFVTATVRYQSLALNSGIDDERFEFVVPKGAKTQPLR